MHFSHIYLNQVKNHAPRFSCADIEFIRSFHGRVFPGSPYPSDSYSTISLTSITLHKYDNHTSCATNFLSDFVDNEGLSVINR